MRRTMLVIIGVLIAGCGGDNTGPNTDGVTLTVAPSELEIPITLNDQATAQVTDPDDELPDGSVIAWESRDCGIAEVTAQEDLGTDPPSSRATIRGAGLGETWVVASVGDASDSVRVTVVPPTGRIKCGVPVTQTVWDFSGSFGYAQTRTIGQITTTLRHSGDMNAELDLFDLGTSATLSRPSQAPAGGTGSLNDVETVPGPNGYTITLVGSGSFLGFPQGSGVEFDLDWGNCTYDVRLGAHITATITNSDGSTHTNPWGLVEIEAEDLPIQADPDGGFGASLQLPADPRASGGIPTRRYSPGGLIQSLMAGQPIGSLGTGTFTFRVRPKP